MQRAVDPAIFGDAVVVLWPGYSQRVSSSLTGSSFGDIAVNLVGAHKNKNGLRAVEARGFQKIHGAERVDFKIENGNVAGFVVRGLRGTVHDQVEMLRTEERFKGYAVPDVDIVVCEVLCVAPQPVEIPSGVAGLAEKNLAHIVVDAVDPMALAVEMFHSFRANEPAGTGNQNCLWLHLKGFLSKLGGPSILCVRFSKFVSMVGWVSNR